MKPADSPKTPAYLPETVTLRGIADELRVSLATVHNWVRTGLLIRVAPGLVDAASYARFKSDVVGSAKLVARANKLHLVAPPTKSKTTSEAALSDFDAVQSPSHRNSEGVYYTPPQIVGRMFAALETPRVDQSFCDPCCGTGNFLVGAIAHGFNPDHVFGFEIDDGALQIARVRLGALGVPPENLQRLDFLRAVADGQTDRRFDVILTNPPWGKKFHNAEKGHFAAAFSDGRREDSAAWFARACLQVLRPHGTLGLLLPEAFFNVSSFEPARKHLLSHSLLRLEDFGRPFKGLQSRAQAIWLTADRPKETHVLPCSFEGTVSLRRQRDFEETPKTIINLHASDEDAQVIRRLFALPHITLKGRARWGLGLVTGDNRRHVRARPLPGDVAVYRGADLTEDGARTPGAFLKPDLQAFQQVAPRALYDAPEKLLYRFICDRLVFHHDTEQKWPLNSANLLIPDPDFPVSMKDLAFYLNSDIMRWLFRSIFRTHKVLRSDLEALPIFAEFFSSDDSGNEKALLEHLGLRRTASGAYRLLT